MCYDMSYLDPMCYMSLSDLLTFISSISLPHKDLDLKKSFYIIYTDHFI